MSEEHFVIVGNGPAGNEAAHTLRQEAPEARVTLISRDRDSCYRPHQLPSLIAGRTEEKRLIVCRRDEYSGEDIKLRSGQTVIDVNLKRKELILDHKEVIPYNGLIIAVGGRPRIPEPYRAFQDLMLTLKTLEDARVWMESLPQVESALLVGSDFTSMAVCKALLHLGKKVTFMLDEEAFWPVRFSEKLAEEATSSLSKRGVEVLAGRRVKSVVRNTPHVYEVQVDDQRLEVGLVGAFFGLVPDISFLARSGLRIDRGILVDEYLNTGFEGVYATGDCAQIYHPEIQDYWVSVGHDNAVTLGRAAALNLAGKRFEAKVPVESIFEMEGIMVNTSWWTEF
jgi:nitrite reductase (NADH) large subunit